MKGWTKAQVTFKSEVLVGKINTSATSKTLNCITIQSSPPTKSHASLLMNFVKTAQLTASALNVMKIIS